MNRIEKVSENISSIISEKLSLNNDEKEVIEYGTFILIQTIISILMIALLGAIFGVLLESMFISFTAATLRKFSGGAHAKSPINCSLIGMFIFVGLALLVKYILINFEFIYLVLIIFTEYVFAFYIMFKYSPVGSANKPLKKETTRKRLKIQSIKLVFVLLVASIILLTIYTQTNRINLLSIAVCITTGVVWQSITLVSLGNYIIEKLDWVLRGANTLKRRTK